jgi:hypothetical protein
MRELSAVAIEVSYWPLRSARLAKIVARFQKNKKAFWENLSGLVSRTIES